MKKKVLNATITLGILLIIIGIVIQFTYKPVTKYKIVFDSNGGTKISDIYVIEGEGFLPPKEPFKGDCFFLGWYLEDGSKYNFANKVTKNFILKAMWSN